LTSSWNGVACAPAREGGGRAGAAAAAGGAAADGGGRGGRAVQTPEQMAAAQEAAAERKKWRESVSMDRVKALRKMYNDAGVTIYAVKMLNTNMTDDEVDWVFQIASALGCTHTTLELTEDVAQLKRLGDFGLKHKIYVAYHTHAQGSLDVFDKAFAASKGNMSNVDFGHYVAGGGGNPIDFLNKFHDRIASFHLKDRTTPEHCALNLPWGTGETPIKEILRTVQKNKWKMPASIELEYPIPQGSDSVQEVRKCLEYCRQALA
jgi:sugar phosphate isomerase/epimerase